MSDTTRPLIELADEAQVSPRTADSRPPIPELPPVKLLAVEDVTIMAPSGVERDLDALYVEVLKFLRIDEVSEKRSLVQPILGDDVPKVPPARGALRPRSAANEHVIRGPVYLAENLRLHIEIHEPPIEHPDFRPVKVQVPLLSRITEALDQRQIAYTKQVGLFPGDRSIHLQDAAGNWVEVAESRPI